MEPLLCSEPVIVHVDGHVQCLASGCMLSRHLHQWEAPCSALDPPCPCEAHDTAELELAAA